MKTEPTASSTRTPSNGARRPLHAARTRGEALARRLKAFGSVFPEKVKEQLQANPYRTLGLACAVGVGAGVVLGSRILRSAASLAIVELGRHYLLQAVRDELATPLAS